MAGYSDHKSAFSRLLASRWTALVAASAGQFLASLDVTVNVALPEITRSFAIDALTVQWIIILYIGSTTGLQMSLGRAADAYGLKRFYLIGLSIYTVAVLLIGLAPMLEMVLGLRVLQAIGNGLILASGPAIVTTIFPPEERGKALGIQVGIASLGMITGALGGGLIVDSIGWQGIFWARVPLCLVTIALAAASIQKIAPASKRVEFDFRGAAALFVGVASFVLFLTLGGRMGWATPQSLGFLILSAIMFVALVPIERRASQPVLDVSIIKNRVIAPAIASGYLMFLASFVNWFVLPFFVTDVLGSSAKMLGMLFMATFVLNSVSSPLSGWLSDKFAPGYLSTVGLVVVTVAMYSYTSLDSSSSVLDVALRMALVGIGMGIFQASNANLVMGAVPLTKLGTGGAIMALSRSMGSVSSVALLGAFFASRLAARGGEGAEGSGFVLAFVDTYTVSAVLGCLAVAISLLYWPILSKRLRPSD